MMILLDWIASAPSVLRNDNLMTIEENLAKIDNELDGAITSGRVKLVAVTKYASDEQVLEAYDLGLRCFGENYVLPALRRREKLNLPDDIEWHLLGTLQRNKVNKAVANFDLIQSVDSLELAKLIDARARKLDIVQDILLQINSTGDKSGFPMAQVREHCRELSRLENINIRGLMTMGPHEAGEISETIFQAMRLLVEELEKSLSSACCELSMGMSNDYSLAVQNGATMIRLGRGLFEIGN